MAGDLICPTCGVFTHPQIGCLVCAMKGFQSGMSSFPVFYGPVQYNETATIREPDDLTLLGGPYHGKSWPNSPHAIIVGDYRYEIVGDLALYMGDD